MNHSPASAHLSEADLPRRETDTRLHGYWLVLARLVCLTLCVLSVGLFVAGILSYIAHLHLLCMGAAAACNTAGQLTPDDVRRLQKLSLTIDLYATYMIILMSLSALGYWLVAALLFWRRSDDRVALLGAASLGTFPIVFNPGINILPSPWWFLAHFIRVLSFLCFSLLFLVFPSGHFVPRWTRWVLGVVLVYWGFEEFFPFSAFNPFYTYQVLGGLVFLCMIVSIVVVQIYRYGWVSSPAQRQQTKWVVYGVSLGWGGYLVLFIIPLFFPSFFQTGSLLSLIQTAAGYVFILLVPLSIGLATLRSRLWDIDILINRTLVYGILSVSVIGVYVLVVGALAALFGTSGNLVISLVA